MKIATWNVNSINKRLNLVKSFIECQNLDILCLQELKTNYTDFPLFDFKLYGYNACYTCFGKNSGVAIISKHPIKIVFDKDLCQNNEARFIVAEVEIENNKISIASVYVPVGGFKDFNTLTPDDTIKWEYKLSFLRAFYKYLKNNKIDFVLGDFNIAPRDLDFWDKDKANFICCSKKEQNIFEEFIKLGYDNVYNILKPNDIAYTWWSYQFGHYDSNWGIRLDHILAQKDKFLYDNISIEKETTMGKIDSSDHAPMLLNFYINKKI